MKLIIPLIIIVATILLVVFVYFYAYNSGSKSVETTIIMENYNDLQKADKIRDVVRQCLAAGRVYENGRCK